MVSGSRFRVHSPFLAMKALTGRRVYVTLPVGTGGEILELYETHDEVGRSRLALIQVNGETLFTFLQDLEDQSEIVPHAQPVASPSH
jgi:hypothetical protein